MKGKLTSPALREQAKALYPLYEDYQKVGDLLGLPRGTVYGIINEDDGYNEFRQQQKRLMIQQAHQKASEALTSIKKEAYKSNTERVIAFATLVDKMAVLAGENAKWSNQVNIGDNRKIEIQVNPKFGKVLKKVVKKVK